MASVVNIGTNINTGASTATIAVTVPAGGIPAGATIVVGTGENIAASNGSCSDSKNGGGYSVAVSSLRGSGVGTGILFYKFNSVALVSGDTITYTLSGLHSAAISACYIAGAANLVNPLDATGSNSGQNNTPTVTSGTPAKAGDMFLAFVSESSVGGLSTFTQDSTNANWQTPPNSTFSGGVEGLYGGSVINTAATARTYAPTPSAATTPNWAALIASFTIASFDMNSQSIFS
jgi:hypothetical protein